LTAVLPNNKIFYFKKTCVNKSSCYSFWKKKIAIIPHQVLEAYLFRARTYSKFSGAVNYDEKRDDTSFSFIHTIKILQDRLSEYPKEPYF
jgi:hypothetical protein